MSIPESISGISLGSAYVRPGDVGPITSITYIAGGWITVDTTSSLNDIDQSRTSTGQIAYVSESKELYIAKKVAADWITTFEDSVEWYEFGFPGGVGFPFSGSAVITGSLLVSQSFVDFTQATVISGSIFSGSFVGDGSGLTGIASALYLTGSSGNAVINLKDEALLVTGSSDGIIVTITNSTASFTISDTAIISGSFSGSYSGTIDNAITASHAVTALTASYAITASHALNTVSASYALSASYAVTASHAVTALTASYAFNASSSLNAITASHALTASSADAFLVRNDLTVQGIVTAKEFHTEFVSASIIYQSGSTQFGDTSDDTHTFTGSLNIQGDIRTKNSGRLYLWNDNSNNYLDYNNWISSTGDTQTIQNTGNGGITFKTLSDTRMFISSSGNIGIGDITPNQKLVVSGSISASGDLYLDGALYDNNKDSGTLGQILQSTATGIDWVDPTGISVQAEQVFATVKNTSGTTLYKGTPVHAVSGSSSGNVNPVIAASASDASTMPATFILNEDLADEAEGLAISLGRITDVDTSAFNVGDIVYVGANGGYTNVKPTGSANLIQNLGVVTKKHASNGAGYVYGSGRSNDVPNLPVGKIWVGSTTYSVTSSLLHLDETNERLGIGVNAPTEMLHVSGNVSASGLIYAPNIGAGEDNSVVVLDSDGTLRTDEIDSKVWTSDLVSGSGTANRVTYWTDTDTLSANDTFYFDGTNVGINTTSPAYRLDINDGNIRVGLITFGTGSAAVSSSLAIGERALASYTGSSDNTAVGWKALESLESTGPNDAFGAEALRYAVAADYNIGFGLAAGYRSQGTQNTFIGQFTGPYYYDVTGGYNTMIGTLSGLQMSGSSDSNTAIGASSLYNMTDASLNTAVGNAAGFNLTTGDNNTFIGRSAGSGITTGSNNTIIGRAQSLPAGLTGTIVIADGDNNQRIYVNNDGNVGLGTTAPGKKLEVYSTTNPEIRINNGGGTSPAPRLTFYRQAGVSATMTYDVSNKNLTIQNDYSTVDANGLIQFNTRGANTRLAISGSGQVRLNTYGSGTFTGTAAYNLSVDSSGNIIETSNSTDGLGSGSYVAYWNDDNTLSGSGDFTWTNSVLTIDGTLEANEKSFNIPHPTQPGKRLIYGVLEGPEHAVYVRGKISGEVIELPEEWTGLVDEDSITVQLTSIGKHQNLYVVDIRDNKVFIKNGDLLTSKINAYYYIQGTRKDTKPLQTVRDK